MVMKTFNSEKGVSRIVTIMALVVFVLIAIIVLPRIFGMVNDKANDTDEYYISAAEKEAQIHYLNDYKGFTAVYDTEAKTFVDEATAVKTVKPYGTSEEHRGMYIIVRVSSDGKITSEWIKP